MSKFLLVFGLIRTNFLSSYKTANQKNFFSFLVQGINRKD